MAFSSDSDFDYENCKLNPQKNKFLEACSNNDFEYVTSNYEQNKKYTNKGLSKSCEHKHKNIISFFMRNGATRCTNCERKYYFKANIVTPQSLYVRKKRFSVLSKNQGKSFGEIASILKDNWDQIDRYEKSIIEEEVNRLNKRNLRCLD